MSRSARRFVLWTFCLALSAGCASQPITRTAQQGSTIAIPIAQQLAAGAIGFGGEWYEDNGIFDDQRGRLTFTYSSAGTPAATVDPLIVTRMYPDPSTVAGKKEKVSLVDGFVEIAMVGQIVALVPVPVITPGQYDLTVGRKIRTDVGVWDNNPTPQPVYSGTIEILPADVNGIIGKANEPEDAGGLDLLAAMDDLYPRPTVVLVLPNDPKPAAGSVVLSFPSTIASLEDVVAPFKSAQDTILSAELTGNVLEVNFVSPYETITAIGVTFTPTDPFPPSRTPDLSDFDVDENLTRLYDQSGARIHNAANPGGIDPDTIVETEIR